MAELDAIVTWCNERLRIAAIADFPGAANGLQVANNGTVTRVGAAVDAGLDTFTRAVREQVDLLVVHHGLFWTPPIPLTGRHYARVRTAILGNLAVYGAHLPLDAHPEIGNNRLLADALDLAPEGTFLPYEGTPVALLAGAPAGGRDELRARLAATFPGGFRALEFGAATPRRIAILTGSGRSALDQLAAQDCDTLITGELRQEHFVLAQELKLNLYLCGHYATETFGVRALAAEIASTFELPWVFLDSGCPL
jgi:dinuclear metal center YbgI/SA1388 family protein